MFVRPKRFRPAISLQVSLRSSHVAAVTCSFFFATGVFAQNLLTTLERETRRLVQEVKPAVVTIMAAAKPEKSGGGLFGLFRKENNSPEVKVGSGLIVSSDGFIVTKESVIRDADHIEITLADDQAFRADIVTLDSSSGMAVLKITGEKFTSARLGSAESVQAGSWVTVIGNALGMPQAVSVGVVSALHSSGAIQISANVDPGSNGSPVFNAQGNAVGIVSGRMGLGPNGVIPENYFSCTSLVYALAAYLPKLREAVQHYYETHGWLGVTVVNDAKDRRHPRVLSLVKDSPAERAGIQIGDVITRFSNKAVEAFTNLPAMVAACKPGSNETLTITRGDSTLQFNVPIGQAAPIALQELQVVPDEAGSHTENLGSKMPAPAEMKKIENLQINQRIQVLEKELKYLRSLQQKP